MKKNVCLAGALLLTATTMFAQEQEAKKLDEVVVSETKFAQAKEKSSKIITVITAEDLKKKQGLNLAQVLNSVAGLEINGNQSRTGKNLDVYIRGGRGRQMIVLIDGIPFTDASGINLSGDLRLLSIDQIEKIEVMKGGSSTLYGSGASAGVINIILKKARKEGYSATAYMNVGTQNIPAGKSYNPQEYNQGISIGSKSNKASLYASLNSSESDGISEAKSPTAIVFEPDAFSRVNSLVKVGVLTSKKLTLDFFGNYDRTKNKFDAGSFSDSKTNVVLNEQYRVGFIPKFQYNKGEVVLNASGALTERDELNYGTKFFYKSRNTNIDLYNKYEVLDGVYVLAGGQFQFHEMANENIYGTISKNLAHFNMIDPYATFVYNSKFGLNINAGLRYNMHNVYGNHLVYNFNPSYVIPNTNLKVLGSVSTAFISPSLYQLYAAKYGKLDLLPEESTTLEFGLEWKGLDNKLNFNTVAYLREDKNAIDFDLDVYKYYTVMGIRQVKGVETDITFKPNSYIQFNANYTFSDCVKASQVLNPKHKVNANLDITPFSRLGINLGYQFVSSRLNEYDTYPAPIYNRVVNSEILNDYKIFNGNIRFVLVKDRMNIFGAVTNILDEDFVEARGYNVKGRNFKLGFNLQF